MKIIFVSIILLNCFCSKLYSESRIYSPFKKFKNSQIDHAGLMKLRNRDSLEEAKMTGGGRPPFKWVERQEILKSFLSPIPGVNTVYIMSASEAWEDKKAPFLGPLVHIMLCIEVDRERNFVSGYAYPLEYSMHFLTGEIREIKVKGDKFVNLARIDFKITEDENRAYNSSGVLDLTWIDTIPKEVNKD